jgi:hypothetical protein
VRVFDVTYRGFDTTPIHGWLIIPHPLPQPKIPCLIHFHGFSGDRGWPGQYLHWTSLGIAVLAIDCREQGGHTGNHAQYNSGHLTNLACKGILDPYEYYFRAVYMDWSRPSISPAINRKRSSAPEPRSGAMEALLGDRGCRLDARHGWSCRAFEQLRSEQRRAENGSFCHVAGLLAPPDDLDRSSIPRAILTHQSGDRIRTRSSPQSVKDSVCRLNLLRHL